MSKLYLAGPMRGIKDYNFPAFDAAAQQLRYLGGHEVLNPADHDREMGFDPKGPPPTAEQLHSMMAWDIRSILDCDAVVFLEGWENSEGARMERAVAYHAGKPCYDYTPCFPELMTLQPGYHRPQIFWTAKLTVRGTLACLQCDVPLKQPNRGLCDTCRILFELETKVSL